MLETRKVLFETEEEVVRTEEDKLKEEKTIKQLCASLPPKVQGAVMIAFHKKQHSDFYYKL